MSQIPAWGAGGQPVSPAEYRSELMIARGAEKKQLFKNASKLGALMILYNICNRVFVYVFYLLAYTRYSGKATLDPAVAIKYIQKNNLASGTGFTMTANLFIVAASAVVLFIAAQPILGIKLTEIVKPYRGFFVDGVKWTPLSITLNILIGIAASLLTLRLNESGVAVPEADFTIQSPSRYAITIQLVYVCVIGPFIEELIYRGLVIKLLSPYGKGLAVFFSALIFGLMHGNISQAFSAFAGGLIYALITVRYNSIAPTVVMHILNNTLASIPDISDAVGFGGGTRLSLLIQIILLFMGFYMLFVLLTQLIGDVKNTEPRCVLHSGERYKVIFTNVFIIVYFLFLIWEFISSFVRLNSGG